MPEELQWAAIPPAVLNIPASLDSGQCFRWLPAPNGDYLGVIGDAAVRLRPGSDGFAWQTYPEPRRWDLIERYFALDVDLEALHAAWVEAEPRIGPSLITNAGLRILRQDAEEAFFSFLCASCNTVVKIRRSIQALVREYGSPIAILDGRELFTFPTARRIAGASEDLLRSHLWGYRAPVLIGTAQEVVSRGEGWLPTLRDREYREAHAELTAMHGIGPKIADCICLFALWHDRAVPIDTHVRQVAVRMFKPELAHRSLTPTVYNTLAGLYRDRFGPYAGWAQQYLFFDELQHTEVA